MTRRRGRTALTLLVAIAVPVLAACGSPDGDDDRATIPTDPAVAADGPATADTQESEPPAPPPPPAENSGTITYAGETVELTGADFYICETVNPAFKGDFNIMTRLGDGTKFRLVGNLEDYSDEDSGLFLGEIGFEERADDLQLELDQRTLSGHGTGPSGAIEFTFSC